MIKDVVFNADTGEILDTIPCAWPERDHHYTLIHEFWMGKGITVRVECQNPEISTLGAVFQAQQAQQKANAVQGQNGSVQSVATALDRILDGTWDDPPADKAYDVEW